MIPEASGSDSLDDMKSVGSKISDISVSFTASMFSVSAAASEVFVMPAPSVFSASVEASAASVGLALLVFSAFSKNSEVSVVSGTSWTSESTAVMLSASLSLMSGFLMSVFSSGAAAGIKSDCWLIALSLFSDSFLSVPSSSDAVCVAAISSVIEIACKFSVLDV